MEFDHIVVGAGSAGCVIARRLVDAGRRVALIEAGGHDDNPAIHEPSLAWQLWNSKEDYAYSTEPQEHSLKTSVFWPRGKVLGGSSALNGMIYVRGARQDFDNWAYNGAVGWTYDEVLPFLKRSEDFEAGPSHCHGSGGPLPVTRNHHPNPVSLAFLAACAEYGIALNDDCNGEHIGVFAKVEPLLGEIRTSHGPHYAASLEKLIDATPDGRKRTAAARERMKAVRAQVATRQTKAAQS